MKVTLESICKISTGQSAPQDSNAFSVEGIPFIRAGSLERLCRGEHESSLEKINEESAKKFRLKLFPKGTIVFAKSGMSAMLGRIYQLKSPCYVVSHLATVTPIDENIIFSNYLEHWFRFNPPNRLIENAAYPSIKTSVIQSLSISLPSIVEQRRIASILDQADELRQKRKQAIEKLDQLLQAKFIDMFGDPVSNPKGFPIQDLEFVALQVTDGTHHTPKRETSGIPLLSARNVLMGRIDFENIDFVGEEEYQRLRKRCEPLRGDILISCSGSIGRVSTVDTDRPFVMVRSAALVKLNKTLVTSKFIEYLLRTPYLQSQMIRSSKSSSQANLFQEPIKRLKILLPSLDLQGNFEKFVEVSTKEKEKLQQSSDKLETLFRSLQNQAFSGTL